MTSKHKTLSSWIISANKLGLPAKASLYSEAFLCLAISFIYMLDKNIQLYFSKYRVYDGFSLLEEIEMSQIRMHKKANFIVHYVINYFHK